MTFDYFEMLSGDPIYVNGVGHIRSPLVSELYPSGSIGYNGYNLFINFLSWDKEEILKYSRVMKYKGCEKLDREQLSAFDVATLLKPTREFLSRVLSFFMTEQLVWDEEDRCYVAMSVPKTENGSGDERPVAVGKIDRNNFEQVRKLMLQFNFIGLEEEKAPIAHSSQKSKELWEMAQGFLKQQAKKSGDDKKEYHLGNMISKVCAAHPSYNILNIKNLTIFQLYDAFFQIGFLRGARLSEMIFSQHGGEDFQFEEWLKPIL